MYKREMCVDPTKEEKEEYVDPAWNFDNTLKQKAKHDKGKIRYTLIPPSTLTAIAIVRDYGTQKYGDENNWRTVDVKRYVDALYRHLIAYISGEQCDRESGFPHTWHIACNIAFIIELERQREGQSEQI